MATVQAMYQAQPIKTWIAGRRSGMCLSSTTASQKSGHGDGKTALHLLLKCSSMPQTILYLKTGHNYHTCLVRKTVSRSLRRLS